MGRISRGSSSSSRRNSIGSISIISSGRSSIGSWRSGFFRKEADGVSGEVDEVVESEVCNEPSTFEDLRQPEQVVFPHLVVRHIAVGEPLHWIHLFRGGGCPCETIG